MAVVFSSFGQTFFISLLDGEIRAVFNLSHGDFDLLYVIGTVSSMILFIWLVRKIDDVDLRIFSACVIVGINHWVTMNTIAPVSAAFQTGDTLLIMIFPQQRNPDH